MREVRAQFKDALAEKLRKGLNNRHVEALLLWHAGFFDDINIHVLEELRLMGLCDGNKNY